jgi:hypothetical protein
VSPETLTILNLIIGGAGTLALAVGGFIANRVARSLDGLEKGQSEINTRLSRVEGRLEPLYKADTPSHSGNWPLPPRDWSFPKMPPRTP